MKDHFKKIRLICLILSINIVMGAVTILPIKLVYSQNEAPRPYCGPIDLAIALDNTNSMRGAINSIRFELSSIIEQAKNQSLDDLKLGFITFKDNIVIHNALNTNLSSVESSIRSTAISYGAELPEASDEAKNTAINNLGPRPNQIGDFSEPWRENATKILILITDAPPGGFNDVMDPEDVSRMHEVALTAQSKGIRVSDVFVPTEGDYAGQAAILRDDATTTGGWFTTTLEDGTGTANAIKEIIGKCGKDQIPKKVISGCTSDTLQHWDKIIFKITNVELAQELGLQPNTELDIKVMDNPSVVVDLKKRIFDFFGLSNQDASPQYIDIIEVEYATICVFDRSIIKE